MAVTLKEYLDRPLDAYCSEVLLEWQNMKKVDVPVTSESCSAAPDL
jgi:hypothetical protein